MAKDDMKNRISMALTDPILQQGFEIICKNLAKLESRNDNLVKMYNEMVERQNSFQQSLYKDLADLEAQIEKMKCCFNCKHSRTEYEHCRTDKHEKWEMKENG